MNRRAACWALGDSREEPLDWAAEGSWEGAREAHVGTHPSPPPQPLPVSTYR